MAYGEHTSSDVLVVDAATSTILVLAYNRGGLGTH